MAGEACLRVATIGRQTRDVVRNIGLIEGIKKVDEADGHPGVLVVAIEGESGKILREVNHISGVIQARLVGNGD